ncbi:unnamed protein product [Amoebophrya sp. A120]|nr:unnamed protein product [Amoebophrya sp. A120]|eukprot:GSA120T00001311001.1
MAPRWPSCRNVFLPFFFAFVFATTVLHPVLVVRAAGLCPAAAEQGCFDAKYTCESCCRNIAVPIGNLSCWEGDIKFATCCGVTNYRLALFQQGEQRNDPLATDKNFGTKEQVCPPTALEQCFDKHFPCERCCDTKYGPQGNPYCWPSVPGLERDLNYGLCCGVQAPFDESVEKLAIPFLQETNLISEVDDSGSRKDRELL